MQLILGSQSPRRAEILNFFNLPYKQIAPNFDEESVIFRDDPQEYVRILASEKGKTLIEQFPLDVVLTADTIVYKNPHIYGKPKNDNEAYRYLSELSGEWHSVWTGLSVFFQDQYFHKEEETRVLFNVLTPEQIHFYNRSFHSLDKAGGYMIQGGGGLIIKKIEGCYYNVMGLPLNALYKVLLPAGINLWNPLQMK